MMRELERAGFSEDQARAVLSKVKRTRRMDLTLVCALVAFLIAGALFISHDYSEKVNVAALKNCQDNNVTRLAQRRSISRGIVIANKDIRRTRKSDPKLFPDIPPAKFQHLINKQVKRLKEQNLQRRIDRNRLPPIDCEARFP